MAAGATWFALGTIDMPSTTPAREWGAALAALLVTLVTMKVLRLYRARQCVQRGQEVARILVAVAVGTIALKLVRETGATATAWPLSLLDRAFSPWSPCAACSATGCGSSAPWAVTNEGSS